MSYEWNESMLPKVALALVVVVGLASMCRTASAAEEARCTALGADCIVSEPMDTQDYGYDVPHDRTNCGTGDITYSDSAGSKPASRGWSRCDQQEPMSTTDSEATPPSGTGIISHVMRVYPDGANNMVVSSGQIPAGKRRICERVYRKFSSNFRGFSVCGANKQQEFNARDGTQIQLSESGGGRFILWAGAMSNPPPGNDIAPTGTSLNYTDCSSSWCIQEICISSTGDVKNFQNITLEGYVRRLSDDATMTFPPTFVGQSGQPGNNQTYGGPISDSWPGTGYRENCNSGTIDYQLFSHAMFAAWDTNAGQTIGASSEFESASPINITDVTTVPGNGPPNTTSTPTVTFTETGLGGIAECAIDCAGGSNWGSFTQGTSPIAFTNECTYNGSPGVQNSTAHCRDSTDIGVNDTYAYTFAIDAVCGDGLITPPEVCDTLGPELGGETCLSQLGYDGTLDCAVGCLSFNTTNCTPKANETGFCTDGFDNDNDGQTDCDDTDCDGDTNCELKIHDTFETDTTSRYNARGSETGCDVSGGMLTFDATGSCDVIDGVKPPGSNVNAAAHWVYARIPGGVGNNHGPQFARVLGDPTGQPSYVIRGSGGPSTLDAMLRSCTGPNTCSDWHNPGIQFSGANPYGLRAAVSDNGREVCAWFHENDSGPAFTDPPQPFGDATFCVADDGTIDSVELTPYVGVGTTVSTPSEGAPTYGYATGTNIALYSGQNGTRPFTDWQGGVLTGAPPPTYTVTLNSLTPNSCVEGSCPSSISADASGTGTATGAVTWEIDCGQGSGFVSAACGTGDTCLSVVCDPTSWTSASYTIQMRATKEGVQDTDSSTFNVTPAVQPPAVTVRGTFVGTVGGDGIISGQFAGASVDEDNTLLVLGIAAGGVVGAGAAIAGTIVARRRKRRGEN